MTETATALLDAAEIAFAEVGFDAASLRSIMREADANPAAVHYHYGSRERLAVAVVERILDPLQRRRLELLDAAVAGGEPDVATLVDALLRPDFEALAEVSSRSARATRILGAIYSRPPEFVLAEVERSFAPVARQFLPHLLRAVDDVDAEALAWRVRWNLFGMLGARMSDFAEAPAGDELERELERCVDAAAAAIAAAPRKESR